MLLLAVVFSASSGSAQHEPIRASEIGADAPTAAEWNVDSTLGFDREIAFTTREGTWMNLDVSPDGSWLVFDLLGDLYRMPIREAPSGDAEGGEGNGGAPVARADRLTRGATFDQIPRISPDGETIAFISDRSGADQLWLMDADGTDRRQVTDVDRWWPTNPYWTPDGEYLVVKRHVKDERSLGGGAIWMYHRGGGAGVPLVERSSFTAEKNEPSVSPNGRYVYYSHAGNFTYNRDPHEGIFQVSRYDRRTGETRRLTDATGGAVRPVPSPDGRRLAFVRRIDTTTALFVRDLETGEERMVFDGLDRDQQETWTVHGAYPAYDWMPDGREVVIFYDGTIHRVDVATGETRTLPFEADVSVPVTETVDFDQDPGTSPRMTARMIRWPTYTPDGEHLIFQAVGSIWQKALPDGEPVRVTTGDRLEFAPAVSPDGEWIAFTSWDADSSGTLWKVPFEPGAQRDPVRLTDRPGQYANPAFSPSGDRIAFVRGSGRAVRGLDLSSEFYLEIAWIGADGDSTRVVSTTTNRGANRRMPRISWDRAGSRIFFHETEGDSTYLTGVAPDGHDERHLVKNEKAEEIVRSPDGRYVAFKELHDVYVAPLPQVGGGPVEIDRNGGPTPVRKLTRWGGNWIDWSEDGSRLSWVLGPTVVRQEIADAFGPDVRGVPPSEGSPPDTTEPGVNHAVPGAVTDTELSVERDRPSGTLALTGARIITMRGDRVIENGTVLVEENRIAAVGPASEVSVPEGAEVRDLAGKTIMPGLVDVHAHMGYMALDVNPEAPWQYDANLAYGVTTTHDPSASTQLVFSQRELVEAGKVRGPRIFSTGFILYGAENDNRALIDTPAEARTHTRRLKAQGAFSVKSYNQLRRDVRQWIIRAARQDSMMVYPEGASMLQQNLTHMIDGHTGIEHAIPVAELGEDVVTLFAESGTDYTPTLTVSYGGLWGENYWYQTDEVYANERLRQFVPKRFLDARARRRQMAPLEEYYHVDLAETARRIVEAGGQVQLGAHGQLQGLGSHWELWMFEQGGMSPLQALRAGTYAGAEYIGMEQELGRVAEGYLADLVVLDANPLTDIRHSTEIHAVMKNGYLYDADLDRTWPAASEHE